jgi:hypothetical protein
MNKFFKDILTGVDKTTYDIGRVMAFASFIGYHVYAVISLYLGHVWSAIDYSSGLSAIFVANGIHLKLKSDTEPGAPS